MLPTAMVGYGHRALFVVLGFGIALTCIAARTLPGSVVDVRSAPDKRVVVSKTLLALYGSGVVLLNVGLGALWGFVERIGLHVGLNGQQVGLALSACTVAMICGSWFAGWLGDRWGRRLPVLVGVLMCGAAAYAAAASTSSVGYLLALVTYGFVYLFVGPYIIVGLPSRLDSSGRLAAAAGGTMWLSYSAGLTVGGLLADVNTLQVIGLLALVTCLGAAAIFASVMSSAEFTRSSAPRLRPT